MSRLDRLNLLLKKSDLDLPFNRCEVSASGSNLTWLRKKLKKQDIGEELHALLALSMHELHDRE